MLGNPTPLQAESALRLELAHGSRIISLPGTEQTIRGYSGVNLLIIDEAARVSDELYYSVRPMLAVSGGRLVLLSTPYGKRGFFHHEYMEGENWQRVKVTAEQCPRISRDFLEEERRTMPLRFFESEYLCTFIEATDAAFALEDIEAAFTDAIVPLPLKGW